MVLVLNPIWVDCIWRSFAFLLNILSGEGLQYKFQSFQRFLWVKKALFLCEK